MFLQITIDAHEPAVLSRFWAQVLGYVPTPPADDQRPSLDLYRSRLGEESEFDDRLFDPDGQGAPVFFQQVPEEKAGKNRVHLDLYPQGRSDAVPFPERKAAVLRRTDELLAIGARLVHQEMDDEAHEALSVLQDPEGNEFCISA